MDDIVSINISIGPTRLDYTHACIIVQALDKTERDFDELDKELFERWDNSGMYLSAKWFCRDNQDKLCRRQPVPPASLKGMSGSICL